jgi:ferrous iron transport protein B
MAVRVRPDDHAAGGVGEKRLVLIGHPNVGKSKIFSLLTGQYVMVSNYPGTTVEVSSGRAADLDYLVADTPGIGSDVPRSEEELVALRTLLTDHIEAVLQVGDAKNLRRTLLLTLALIETKLPLVLDLNMADEAERQGYSIDTARLSQSLGFPVAVTVATEGRGKQELLQSLRRPSRPKIQITYDPRVENAAQQIAVHLPDYRISKKAVALVLLSANPSLVDTLLGRNEKECRAVKEIIERTQSEVLEPLQQLITNARMSCVERLIRECQTRAGQRAFRSRFAGFLDKVSVHPVWGAVLLFGIIFAVYEFVGVFAAGMVVDFFHEVLFGKYLLPPVVGAVSHIPNAVVRDFLVGPYGQVTMGITLAVAIVLPTVTAFFFVFSIMEDSGYLPRLQVMLNRMFAFVGLNGKAVIPIVLGFGCGTMAVIVTRILETRRERIIATLILALGVPCAPQMGLILGLFAKIGFIPLLLFLSFLAGQLIVAGWLASKLFPGEQTAFVTELPPYRLPQIGNVVSKTVYRTYSFVREVVPWFLAGTALLFLADITGVLPSLKRLMEPVVVGLLDLPRKTSEGFILGFLRREYVAAYFFDMYDKGLLDNLQAFVSAMVMTLFIPCSASTFIIVKERGLSVGLAIIGFVTFYAIVAGTIINFALRFLHITF